MPSPLWEREMALARAMIDKLDFLLAVAREKHFGRAAEACGVTQPTLSAGLKQLEQALGAPLVNRSSRFIGLTPEGERVLAYARRMVGDARAMREVIMPTIRGMESDGIPYTGFLYAGLMIDPKGGIRTLEFNCRLGDPETQPILMRLKTELYDVLMAATSGSLDQVELEWDRRIALGVVMAAHGYPMSPRKGDAGFTAFV